eukprot:1519305-Pyramimonas_sp.AAC.1
MRSKLYMCSEEQVRPATRQESLGAELLDAARFDQLREEVRAPGRRIGAVDVASEGPPPPGAWGRG